MPSPLNIKSINFPFDIGNDSFPRKANGNDAILSNVRSLLFTGRGEVPMRPAFGTGLHDFVFDEITPIKKSLLATEIRRVLNENIPKMRILGIEVSSVDEVQVGNNNRGTRVLVNISYAIGDNVGNVNINM